MAKLVLSLNGTVLNQCFTDKPALGIGSTTDNDIVVDDPQVREHHARILCIGEDHILESQDSEAGVPVNGKPCFRQILQHRDVIHLGAYHLRYLNSRIASELSMDRTMLIEALPRDAENDGGVTALPSARASKISFPEGYVHVLKGRGQHLPGEDVVLDRVVTTFGTPGEQLVVLTLRPQSIYVTHVEGAQLPRVNQKTIGREPVALADGDQIEAAGYRLQFHLGRPPAKR